MSKRSVILLQGGLGNQLFQLCAMIKFSGGNSSEVVLDGSLVGGVTRGTTPRELEIHALLNPSELLATRSVTLSKLKLLFARCSGRLVRDRDLEKSDLMKRPGSRYLAYFQDHNLVESVWPDLCERLKSVDGWSEALLQPLEKRLTIHFRLGDYVSNSKATKFHGITKPEYFVEIAQAFRTQHPEDPIHIVSDDVNLASELLKDLRTLPQVNIEDDKGPLEALKLLATSSTVAISNSSFSWWGGWLAFNKGATVIAPKPWFSDDELLTKLIHPKWITKQREPITKASDLTALMTKDYR